MEEVWGYDGDQVALVIPDSTAFGSRVLVTLGTPTINQIINMIKDSKTDELLASLNGSRISHLLACCWAELSTNETVDLTDLNKAVKRIKREEIEAFSSKVMHSWTKTILLGKNMHVMKQTLKGDDGPCLPHSLSVMNTYTKMTTGKEVAVMVKNLIAAPITIIKGIKVAQVVAANMVPQEEDVPETFKKLDEMQGIQQTRMSVEQREVLFQQLYLSGLGVVWQKQAAAHALLAEYHDIFSLDPGKLGCTDLVKHKIRVIDNKPFKERFQRIPPSMVDEIHVHVKEMLDVGTIHPSQNPWCNTVVLVCKKDGGLCFYIDFWKLNARTKKESYLLPWIQEATEGLVGAGYFSCLDVKAGFWQIAMVEAWKQYTAFTRGSLGIFECKCMPFALSNAPATFQRLMENCLGELNLTYCLIYLDDVIVFSKTEKEYLQCLCTVFNCFRIHNLRLKSTQCEFFWNEINYLADHISKEGVWPSKENLKAVAKFTPPQIYIETQAFLGLLGHYWQFIKGFACIAQTYIWGRCQQEEQVSSTNGRGSVCLWDA